MSTYTPDRWVVVVISNGEKTYSKVLAGWYGGFAAGDSWKLSSSIIAVVDHETHYEFKNSSGSTYICYKNSYGMSMYMSGVYGSFEQDISTHPDASIKIEEKYEPNRTN